MTLVLISAPPSPYARKVAIALIEKGLEFTTHFDEPWGDARLTVEHSPLEQLPILVTDDGERIYDSAFILDWLEIAHPEPPLLPRPAGERIAALRQRMLGERLMEIAQALIFEQFRPEPSAQAIARLERKIPRGLVELEKAFHAPPADAPIHQGHIAAATTLLVWEFVIAQNMCPPLDSLLWRTRHPGLARAVDALDQRESFRRTRPAAMRVDIAAEVG